MSTDRLLTLMQLATKWGWSRSKLTRLVTKQGIPHLRIGARNDVYFRESVVEAWLLERAVPVASAPRHRGDEPGWSREEECRALGIEVDHQFS